MPEKPIREEKLEKQGHVERMEKKAERVKSRPKLPEPERVKEKSDEKTERINLKLKLGPREDRSKKGPDRKEIRAKTKKMMKNFRRTFRRKIMIII